MNGEKGVVVCQKITNTLEPRVVSFWQCYKAQCAECPRPFPEFWMRYMGLMDFHWRMICFSLSFSLTFPLNQTISIVSQISYKLSDLIYIHISIINYHSYVVSSRIDLVVYCYWILWLLRNKTSIISTVITHNQQKKMYTQLKFFCVLKTNVFSRKFLS